MFYIIDLSNGDIKAKRKTKDELLMSWLAITHNAPRWALKSAKLTFDLLNITGKDTIMRHEPTGKRIWNYTLGYSFPEYSWVAHLRPYQVLDDYGNPVDIRTWTDAINRINAGEWPITKYTDTKPLPRFRIDPAGWGRKQHSHRVNMGAMMYRQLRAQHTPVMDDEDMINIKPLIDHTRIRNPISYGDSWDSYENKHDAKWCSSKAWKDQSKSHRQWAKQKPGHKRRNCRRPVDTFASTQEIAMNCGIPFVVGTVVYRPGGGESDADNIFYKGT